MSNIPEPAFFITTTPPEDTRDYRQAFIQELSMELYMKAIEGQFSEFTEDTMFKMFSEKAVEAARALADALEQQ